MCSKNSQFDNEGDKVQKFVLFLNVICLICAINNSINIFKINRNYFFAGPKDYSYHIFYWSTESKFSWRFTTTHSFISSDNGFLMGFSLAPLSPKNNRGLSTRCLETRRALTLYILKWCQKAWWFLLFQSVYKNYLIKSLILFPSPTKICSSEMSKFHLYKIPRTTSSPRFLVLTSKY